MTTEAITPLRQRMIEDMNSRKLCALAQPRKKLRKAPEKAPGERQRDEQHGAAAGVSAGSRVPSEAGGRGYLARPRAAWRSANAGHVSLAQLKIMSAIERCRTAALGGMSSAARRSHTVIAYNSCRNRHCPNCQGAAARERLAEREAELLPVPYYHVVFTLPARIADIAYQNKAVIYDLLFKASSETMLTIAAPDRRRCCAISRATPTALPSQIAA